MELILNEVIIKPTLCLNMIVKDESHIIVDTLTKLLNKIKFDYWVISDTGSTDNTKELITEFFKNHNIKGELFEDKWQDFGYNRTKALEHAYNKSEYVLIFDADDEIVGDFVLPELTKDSYFFQFGSEQGTSYIRIQIVNNKKKWKYVGVLHEMITCIEHSDSSETITGNYFTISGRTSSRNRDENKYLKDALILEKAYEECIKNNDTLYHRYGFYCANSYFDSGKWEDAIKWYKITLNNDNWSQEKYMSCLRLFQCYNNLKNTESGIFYLIKSFEYDKERVECLYELVVYYCLKNLNDVAYGFYSVVKEFFNNKYISVGVNDKLFLDLSKANFYLPYYMILVADKMKDNDTIIKMYKIAFTKKYIETNTFFVGNLLYNLQFFIESAKDDQEFLDLFNDYIVFLKSINYPIYSHEFMKSFEKYGIKVNEENKNKFSQEECIKSNNILVYTGFSNCNWNYTYSLKNALGGSETAVINLTKSLPNNYKIYIAGVVAEEKVNDNITFCNLNSLRTLAETIPFHTVIVSRYIGFYEIFPEVSFYQSFIWGHDIILFPYGCPLDTNSILKKWNKKINKCICQTEWHKNCFLNLYPELNDKIITINNGISLDKFTFNLNKVSNKFIYTSCSERGLDRLLELWPQIIENLPDAELYICSYNKFPSNEYEKNLNEIINKYNSITHLGCLNKDDLYKLMSTSEYWLYPTNFDETSCITSMEMLMSEVICIYYPRAGLVNTLGDYGIPVERGNEIDTILNLSNKEKISIKKRGKEYALSCSWENRTKEWVKLINENEEITEKLPIYIINLNKRTDRKEKIEKNLINSQIDSFNFFEAINGKELKSSDKLFSLFERNDFNYKKGVIGCALSHIKLWNNLLTDPKNEFYIILEDDITFCNNFKKYLSIVCKLFIEQNLEHLALGEYFSNKQFPTDNSKLEIYTKDLYSEWNVTFAYIISKSAAKKAIDYINSCSIKCAFDNPQAFGYILNYSALNYKLVSCEILNEHGSDIQTNNKNDFFEFTPLQEKNILSVSFCDWWEKEYSGGLFDFNDNFFTNLLREYGNNYEIKIVNPTDNPDILFYSIFGFSHKNYIANRKIFFSGEPYSQRVDANLNITFDRNSINNTRLPLWLCYFNKSILEECEKRKNNQISIPNREKFCSFIASGPGLANNRQEFVEKLSKYKQVDCGGSYLNNIGYNVPLGLNCSGKIEHNNNYKFAMAFESTSYPGYVTEKICDVFKSNCIPIYWGTNDVVKDFNPMAFINANNFSNFDELIDYIIKVDNDEELYKSFFKQQILSREWLDILNDPNKTFFKNLADKIIGKQKGLFDNLDIIYNNNSDNFLLNCIDNLNQIETYSQASQDIFVTNVLKHKKNGYFLEIGTNDPIIGNNSYILEKKYNFKGVLVEYEKQYEESYKKYRKNSIYIIDDARKIDYKNTLEINEFPKNIDYLQIDLDVDNKSTLETLLLFDETIFDTYKFATITFEHDFYRGDFFNTRQISREIFKKRGYCLVFPDICTDQGCVGTGWQPFEDWYVHPDLVDMNFINIIKTEKSLRNDHIKNILINTSNITSNNSNKNEKMKVIFSNNCSVGDVYFSQPFIKNIVENNPDNDYYIYHQTCSYYFTDILKIKDVNKIPELKELLYQVFNFKINLHDLVNIDNMSSYIYRYDKTNNILLICTWLGCIRRKYPDMLECNMIKYNDTYKLLVYDLNKDLNINLKFHHNLSLDIYPEVPTLNINKFIEFKHKFFDKKIIFYYNFLPSSGQSYPIKNYDEHNEIIKNLSENNIVVIPHKQSYKGTIENVYFADDFLENVDYYDAKNFYYHAQMAYESDYSIYYDLGRGFMSMNKTFIKNNNSNIRLHITNNEYFYNSLNNNFLIPKDYIKLIKVNNYMDILNKLNDIINFDKNNLNSNDINFIDIDNIKKLKECPNKLCFKFRRENIVEILNSVNNLYKLGMTEFSLQKTYDESTLFYDLNNLIENIINCDYDGFILCK